MRTVSSKVRYIIPVSKSRLKVRRSTASSSVVNLSTDRAAVDGTPMTSFPNISWNVPFSMER